MSGDDCKLPACVKQEEEPAEFDDACAGAKGDVLGSVEGDVLACVETAAGGVETELEASAEASASASAVVAVAVAGVPSSIPICEEVLEMMARQMFLAIKPVLEFSGAELVTPVFGLVNRLQSVAGYRDDVRYFYHVECPHAPALLRRVIRMLGYRPMPLYVSSKDVYALFMRQAEDSYVFQRPEVDAGKASKLIAGVVPHVLYWLQCPSSNVHLSCSIGGLIKKPSGLPYVYAKRHTVLEKLKELLGWNPETAHPSSPTMLYDPAFCLW
jgi:hypothetical protein